MQQHLFWNYQGKAGMLCLNKAAMSYEAEKGVFWNKGIINVLCYRTETIGLLPLAEPMVRMLY